MSHHPSPQQPQFSDGAQPKRKKKPLFKRWWFWLLVIVVVIIAFSAANSGGGEEKAADGQSEQKSDQSSEQQDDAAKTYKIGDTVTADDWEITVESVDDGVKKVGDEFLNSTAQGQFVKVGVTVKNTSSSPAHFSADSIKLGDDKGNTYSSDSEAGLYASKDSLLFEEINPGNTAKGTIVFDVPKDVSPDRLTFEGGLFSTPVEISLK